MKKEDVIEEVYDYEWRLSNAEKRLSESQIISSEDKETVRRFVQHLKAQGVSTGRLAKYTYHLKNAIERLGTSVQQAKRADIEGLVAWLQHDSGYTPHTISDYLFAIKRFFKFARCGNVDRETPYPEEVRWVKTAMKPNERKEPLFFTSEEVEAMIKAATNLRDKAMLAVGYEAGLRATELLTLNIGSVVFDDRGARLHIERGKTGSRVVRLITSVSLLARYLEVHPFRNEPSSPLWLTESTNYMNHRLSWVRWNRCLKQVAQRAGVKKRVFNHMLRHGSATRNAKFLTDSELKLMYGWSMSSKMPAVYVHLSGRDLDDKLTALYAGKEVEPIKPEFTPIICPRCNERASRGMVYCPKCASPLDDVARSRMQVEDETTRDELTKLRKVVEKYLSDAPTS
ncbi:MAG: tyrosine-type recombinase/integrase [Nitrososphaerota archaeon]|nr:tyrosine-type recombinase/integrase [Nitrososphaerota archaeon]